jgi:hypothetical protein
MRRLFSDGTNSVAHVVLGVLSVWNPVLLIVFFLYEFFKHPRFSDAYAGILEFLIGYAVALISERRAVFPSLLL